jgi:hypothetical protein
MAMMNWNQTIWVLLVLDYVHHWSHLYDFISSQIPRLDRLANCNCCGFKSIYFAKASVSEAKASTSLCQLLTKMCTMEKAHRVSFWMIPTCCTFPCFDGIEVLTYFPSSEMPDQPTYWWEQRIQCQCWMESQEYGRHRVACYVGEAPNANG